MVAVSKDGPYLITGGIDLIGDNIQWAEGASKERYTLCRCGASNDKPFGDGMHRTVNFKDDKKWNAYILQMYDLFRYSLCLR
jgi:CDGSH-type Zn-finger protein